MTVSRRGFVASVAALGVSGCLDSEGAEGALVVYAVPEPDDKDVVIPLEEVETRPVQVAVQTAPVYKGRDPDDGLDATSTPLDTEPAYNDVRRFLDSTPSVEAGNPYPVGGTVIRYDGSYFVVDIEDA